MMTYRAKHLTYEWAMKRHALMSKLADLTNATVGVRTPQAHDLHRRPSGNPGGYGITVWEYYNSYADSFLFWDGSSLLLGAETAVLAGFPASYSEYATFSSVRIGDYYDRGTIPTQVYPTTPSVKFNAHSAGLWYMYRDGHGLPDPKKPETVDTSTTLTNDSRFRHCPIDAEAMLTQDAIMRAWSGNSIFVFEDTDRGHSSYTEYTEEGTRRYSRWSYDVNMVIGGTVKLYWGYDDTGGEGTFEIGGVSTATLAAGYHRAAFTLPKRHGDEDYPTSGFFVFNYNTHQLWEEYDADN